MTVDHLPPTNPILDPARWWRRLCWIDQRIALCGDLPEPDVAARAQLEQWIAEGVTVIVDVRGEHSDERRVAEWAPHVTYIRLGTHDNGGDQDDRWFILGVEAVLAALAIDPDAKVVIHCHMGVNRAPSLAFAVLLALGLEPVEAMTTMRAARPIAAAVYAPQALDTHLWARGVPGPERSTIVEDFADWHRANRVDMGWVISRIRRAEWQDEIADEIDDDIDDDIDDE